MLQVFSSVAIIGLVLLQRGKGADAGAGFGAGASGTVFGARGARTALSRATAIFAAIFMMNSLALAYMGSQAQTDAAEVDSGRGGRDGACACRAPAVPRAVPDSPAPASTPAGRRGNARSRSRSRKSADFMPTWWNW